MNVKSNLPSDFHAGVFAHFENLVQGLQLFFRIFVGVLKDVTGNCAATTLNFQLLNCIKRRYININKITIS